MSILMKCRKEKFTFPIFWSVMIIIFSVLSIIQSVQLWELKQESALEEAGINALLLENDDLRARLNIYESGNEVFFESPTKEDLTL